jgi:zinc transport system ATP-binding protein
MPGPAIDVNQLSLQLGGNSVLDNMSFSIAAGALHCFVGPNGGGKSSTARCLLGQMPHKGTVKIAWPNGKQGVTAYIPQLIEMERTLPLTIDDFMRVISQNGPAFAGSRQDQRASINQVLERLELHSKRRSLIGSLSGGERQRLLFAQALLPKPDFLVLDEPMTSLDEAGARLFERLILELNQEGTTVLWINHELEQVARLAHSVTVINKTVLAHGPTASTLSPSMRQGVFAAQQTGRGAP